MRETWVRSLGWEDPWAGRRERLCTPVFWPGEFHGLVHGVAKSWTWLCDFHHPRLSPHRQAPNFCFCLKTLLLSVHTLKCIIPQHNEITSTLKPPDIFHCLKNKFECLPIGFKSPLSHWLTLQSYHPLHCTLTAEKKKKNKHNSTSMSSLTLFSLSKVPNIMLFFY